jgi:hypothetical protein
VEQISTIVKTCGLLYINDEYTVFSTPLYRRAKSLSINSEGIRFKVIYLGGRASCPLKTSYYF